MPRKRHKIEDYLFGKFKNILRSALNFGSKTEDIDISGEVSEPLPIIWLTG
jgi:hypothetical protein